MTDSSAGAATNVAATVASPYSNDVPPLVVLGATQVSPTTFGPQQFWWVVLDLTNDLAVVANETSTDPTSVPTAIAPYLGQSQYFLYFVTLAQITGNVPQGALHAFLQKLGSGAQLARLEQIIGALSTGAWVNYSYILGATTANDDLPGFETMSLYEPGVLTMQFMPVAVQGQTIWAPVAGPVGAADAAGVPGGALPRAAVRAPASA